MFSLEHWLLKLYPRPAEKAREAVCLPLSAVSSITCKLTNGKRYNSYTLVDSMRVFANCAVHFSGFKAPPKPGQGHSQAHQHSYTNW